jgi:hypothetical protein
MKRTKYRYSVITLVAALIIVISYSCEREMEGMQPADYPTDGDVFIDGFSTGLGYEAWGDVSAFEVDKEISYSGEASMRFAVPDEGETGGYAGGRFVASIPRDLSGYDALTFWAKASTDASIDKIGFGNNAEGSKYLATINGLKVNTNWKKFIIPLPDPAKLTKESGMFYYTEAPEEGSGYTFWIDEVKFEKLGTLAHQQPEILNGEDKVSKTFNGINIPIAGISYIANLPNGVNQAVEIAPSYFTFSSSASNVASIDENGMVSVLSAGSAVIKGTIADAEAVGSLTVESAGDFESAPEPAVDPAVVISVFSDSYTNAPVEYYNGYWQPYQTTLSADFEVAGNHVLNYTNLNFVGIQFSSPTINASNMTHLHLDIFVPNEVNPQDKLLVRLVALGADGTFDDPNPSISITLESPDLVSQEWISLDMDLSGLTSKGNLAQIIFENLASPLSNFYVDNIYFYNDGGGTGVDEPAEAAPTPTHDAANVISIYSDAYANLEGTDYPDWGQTTVVSDVSIDGNNTLKFAGLNFQGIELANSQDLSDMDYLHIDYWTKNSTALNAYLISSGPVEKAKLLTVPNTGWTSIDIPLTDFSPTDLADIIQMKFDGNGDIFLDNIYFYTTGGGTTGLPTIAAPSPPARDAADVISLFSNAYTNSTVDTWSAEWDDSDVADLKVAGDDIKKYSFTNFAGIDFSNHKFDASEMTNFHMDIWTPDEVQNKSLTVKLVDFGGGNAEATSLILTVVHTSNGNIPALAKGSWVSIDVPFQAFTGDKTRSDLAQMVLSCNIGTVFIDNVYFYKSGGGSAATEPTSAAPAPPAKDAADVVSIFSEAYNNLAGTDFNPGWGQSTVVSTIDIAGNSTLKYANFNYQGTVLATPQDLTGMNFLHVDMWTADATVVQVTPINNSGSPAEKLVSLTPITPGQWKSYDIPLTSFTSSGMTLNEVFQMKFDGQAGNTPSTIYLDNIYFYKGSGGGGGGETGPTAAAPTPPARDAGNVVSIYSDAYTPITIGNFDAGWCGGAAVTEVEVAGNKTLKKNAGIECQGIDFSSNRQDLSSFTHIHFDFYTDDTDLTGDVFNVKLVDFAGGSGEASALEVNINTGTTPAIVAGSWVSVDIDITSLGGIVTGSLTRSDVAQIGITTANLTNVWYDNIYLYK